MADLFPKSRLVRKRNLSLEKQLELRLQLLSQEYRQTRKRIAQCQRDCGYFLYSLHRTAPGLQAYLQPDTRAMHTNALLRERRHSLSSRCGHAWDHTDHPAAGRGHLTFADPQPAEPVAPLPDVTPRLPRHHQAGAADDDLEKKSDANKADCATRLSHHDDRVRKVSIISDKASPSKSRPASTDARPGSSKVHATLPAGRGRNDTGPGTRVTRLSKGQVNRNLEPSDRQQASATYSRNACTACEELLRSKIIRQFEIIFDPCTHRRTKVDLTESQPPGSRQQHNENADMTPPCASPLRPQTADLTATCNKPLRPHTLGTTPSSTHRLRPHTAAVTLRSAQGFRPHEGRITPGSAKTARNTHPSLPQSDKSVVSTTTLWNRKSSIVECTPSTPCNVAPASDTPHQSSDKSPVSDFIVCRLSHPAPNVPSVSHPAPDVPSVFHPALDHTDPDVCLTSHTDPDVPPVSHTDPDVFPTSHTNPDVSSLSHPAPDVSLVSHPASDVPLVSHPASDVPLVSQTINNVPKIPYTAVDVFPISHTPLQADSYPRTHSLEMAEKIGLQKSSSKTDTPHQVHTEHAQMSAAEKTPATSALHMQAPAEQVSYITSTFHSISAHHNLSMTWGLSECNCPFRTLAPLMTIRQTPTPKQLVSKLLFSGRKDNFRSRPKTAPPKYELTHRSLPASRQTVAGILAQIENHKAAIRAKVKMSKDLRNIVKKLVPCEQSSMN